MVTYLNYLADTVHRRNRKAVDQEAALFLGSEFQHPQNSVNRT